MSHWPSLMTKVFVDNDEDLRQYFRVMAKQRLHPTKAELAILQVLWTKGPLSVRDVQAILDQSRPTGYTTVLKTMQIMAEKGLVERDDTVRPQIYRPRQSEDRTQKQLLTDLIQRVYGGSVKALVLHAIGTRKPSAEDLDAIEKLLDRFAGDKK
jgi:BlaI family transcriptional regulator, penicillinase repressor